MVNSEAKNYSCEHAKKLQQQKDIRRDEIVSLYSSYYRVSMTVKRINEVFGRINRTYFFLVEKVSLNVVQLKVTVNAN
jgi:hypothetical protein